MKKVVLWSMLVLMSGIVLADGPEVPPGAPRNPGPCRQIMKACRDAGFKRGQAEKGKGLMKDCFGPILKGQTVPGVSVDPSVVQACQQKAPRRKRNMGGQAGQGGQAAPAVQGNSSSQ